MFESEYSDYPAVPDHPADGFNVLRFSARMLGLGGGSDDADDGNGGDGDDGDIASDSDGSFASV